jgi:hypothetical protein
VGSRIAIGPGIEEVEPCPCQGAPKAAVFPDALLFFCYKKNRCRPSVDETGFVYRDPRARITGILEALRARIPYIFRNC